jgi:hypothetical protein
LANLRAWFAKSQAANGSIAESAMRALIGVRVNCNFAIVAPTTDAFMLLSCFDDVRPAATGRLAHAVRSAMRQILRLDALLLKPVAEPLLAERLAELGHEQRLVPMSFIASIASVSCAGSGTQDSLSVFSFQISI